MSASLKLLNIVPSILNECSIKELVVVLETPYLLCRGQVSSRQLPCNPTHVTFDLSRKEMGKKNPTFINFSFFLTEGVIDVKNNHLGPSLQMTLFVLKQNVYDWDGGISLFLSMNSLFQTPVCLRILIQRKHLSFSFSH